MDAGVETHPGTEQPKLRWTREEAERLTEMFPDQRFELIEGELINKMGQNPPHAYVIAVLTRLLGTAFAGKLRIQMSIDLPAPDNVHSAPEPDVVLLYAPIEGIRQPSPVASRYSAAD
jgi:hypothetical protein